MRTLLLLAALTIGAHAERPNVLFIAIDDLRPELGCYGKSHIHSPHIDQLAATGTLFERAYCMVPTCGASRASLMTGLRPTPKRFVTFKAVAEKEAPGITTLNTHFKQNGYRTISLGKVFHDTKDNAAGWSNPPWKSRLETYQLAASKAAARTTPKGRGPAFESSSAAESKHRDAETAEEAIQRLQDLGRRESPFFLAVGFVKPHLPFVAPKKYFDRYDPADIHLPPNAAPPLKVPHKHAIHNSGELRQYAGVPKGTIGETYARQLIHGYYACVSFVDAQVGKVLAELDRLGLADNTIVVLWGDHGWNLGEHTLWCKHSCFETSMHAPLVVRAPGVGKPGQRVRGLTEFIDIYPGLCELAGLPLPPHLQGESFVPLLKDPGAVGKTAALGRFRNGDTIRTSRFRFTRYADKGRESAFMLYNHDDDPGETKNLADEAAFEDAVDQLRKQLPR